MDVRQANKLFEQMERLSAEVSEVRDALHVEFLSSQLAEVVDTDYDLGDVARVEQVLGGYVNLSFAVVTCRDDGEHRYFVRKYNRAVIERAMIERTRGDVIVMADGSKIGVVADVMLCGFEKIDVVMLDDGVDSTVRDEMTRLGLRCIVV